MHDLIVIGAGPGGYRAAAAAAQGGLKTLLIERKQLGGTCLNEGCIPTKTYARNAEIVDTLSQSAQELALDGVAYHFDFAKAAARKDTVTAQLRDGIATMLAAAGVETVSATARLTGPHTVETDSGQTYEAGNIIIATGSSPKMLRLEECDPDTVITSDDLLHATSLPKSIAIVGAGVIGMEFACILSSFGVEVTVVEFLKECLPPVDADVAKRLRKQIERRGVKFVMQAGVKAVRKGEVVYERKGKTESVAAEKVLIAVGRRPNIEGLGLEAAGVSFSPKGIEVDGSTFRTSVDSIFAIGDVNGRQMLAHAATMQGIRAVNTILGREDSIRLSVMPAAIFTHPEAACVGKTEEQCKAEGVAIRVGKSYYRANGKALAMNEPEGMVKLITAADSGLIIGCHAFGAHAADIVQEAAALMCRDTTGRQLADIVHIHPTLGELLQEAAM